MGQINPQQENIKSGIDIGKLRITEGKNVIYMSHVFQEEKEIIVKYLDKKYRVVGKEPGSKPLSKKESSVKTLL